MEVFLTPESESGFPVASSREGGGGVRGGLPASWSGEEGEGDAGTLSELAEEL